MPSGPLADVSVTECASYLGGPCGGPLRPELGADVVTVEVPGNGDPFRRRGGTGPEKFWVRLTVDPHVLEAGLLRQASGPAGERFLVPRGAIAYAGDLDACPMEVPALGG